jgi:hypothetical protein
VFGVGVVGAAAGVPGRALVAVGREASGAAEHRGREHVCLVSSDAVLRGTSGQEVTKRSSRTFLTELAAPGHAEPRKSELGDRVDAETRARLGITDGLLRLSVGLEHVDDIVKDVERALEKSR